MHGNKYLLTRKLFLHVKVEDMVNDEYKAIEKSRMPAAESNRIGFIGTNVDKTADKESGSDSDSDSMTNPVRRDGNTRAKAYDLEVYDDRQFYSLLLKVLSTQ
jgi:hypothetical protein